ncbi:MAG: hypothetical protein CME59_12245 [Halioglobus sp.]|nr:hypothetical protein [Halioglobus sp.]|tara:strand:- start:4783 stop:6105 length:1323 start_codon:yes stop_codon:yes gene_type:complete
MHSMAEAEQALLAPENHPPEPTSRVLADGYRYMLAHINREIEMNLRNDPRFPEFFRSMDMLRKWTGENPDTMYLKAPIDASGYYRVVFEAQDTAEWRRPALRVEAEKAPRLVTFQTITSVPGNSGELAEMADCSNQTLDAINSLALQGENGRYEILVGPERPAGHQGNFLLSKREMPCPASGEKRVAQARYLSVREIFSDWEYEVPLDMEITRLDSVGANRPPLGVDDMAEIIERTGRNVRNQIRFWNLVMAFPMEMADDRNGDGRRALPLNGINQPAPPFTAGGVAGAQQLYAAGIFDLEDDEALLIKMTAPLEPYYVGFQLNNLWMEGPDQQNYVSSLSGAQNPPSAEHTRYYIIAARDPGVRGWVDTTGIEWGFHSMRFVFARDPSADELPVLEATRVKLSEVRQHLPQDYPQVTPQQRMAEVALRQSHIKRRWRGH